ncbi:hypothetical protein Ade02nite_54460 [Paractinoplanes deccanensis]|uniref:DUF4386 family protein n=1 Tax=Paractinoplanes deccanensis TaxID=113561 RepID=A0ABQ3Y9W8_9ACTN|nr:hypothetical protein [Actinoplanes deccanensis]GID76805.1 hypothetical protein Ade02nite_54460 [Actinoplanes deccanensis]
MIPVASSVGEAGNDSHPSADTYDTRLRRFGLAAAAFLAPWCIVACNLGWAMAQAAGASDQTGADALAAAAAHPTLLHNVVLFGMLGALLMIPAGLGAARLAGRGAAKLSFIAGTLVAAGYACYLAVLLTDLTTIAMVRVGGPMADFATVLDTRQQDAAGTWVFLLFVLGNVVGTFLLGLALWRSRAITRWAAAAIMIWPPMHIAGLAAGVEWFEVTGAAVQGLGFAAVGVHLLRRAG